MIDEIKNIDILIRARYPLIYIVSSEEQRVIKTIASLTKAQTWVWSCVSGIVPHDKLGEVSDATKDPMAVLRFINNNNENGIFILCDFHQFLDSTQSYDIIRFLKEMNTSLKKVTKNVIILSPVLKIPVELEKEINVVDFPLPNKEEIIDIYDEIANAFKNNPKIKLNGNKEFIIKALQGLNTSEIENVLYKSIIKDKCFSLDTIIAEKKQVIRKTGILEYYHTTDGIDDVGGYDVVKRWMVQRKGAFTDDARAFGLPYPKGVLLYGVQGCGKSLCCKVISNIWKFPLLRLDMGAVMGGIVGESEGNIRRVIRLAEAIAPCILWVDEVEKAFSGIKSSNQSDSGTTARVFASFITWLQEKISPVFVIATANDINALPPEFMRKGRFDDIFFIDLPNPNEREEIFTIHIKKRNRDITKFDIPSLARQSGGFSGAEIESAVISALFDAYDDHSQLNDDYIFTNLHNTVPLSKTMEEKITYMREWARSRARPATSNVKESISRGVEL